eukprot:UN24798
MEKIPLHSRIRLVVEAYPNEPLYLKEGLMGDKYFRVFGCRPADRASVLKSMLENDPIIELVYDHTLDDYSVMAFNREYVVIEPVNRLSEGEIIQTLNSLEIEVLNNSVKIEPNDEVTFLCTSKMAAKAMAIIDDIDFSECRNVTATKVTDVVTKESLEKGLGLSNKQLNGQYENDHIPFSCQLAEAYDDGGPTTPDSITPIPAAVTTSTNAGNRTQPE